MAENKKEQRVETGVRRTFWIQKGLDEKVEVARKQLGLGRSGFYRFALVELLWSHQREEIRELGANDGSQKES